MKMKEGVETGLWRAITQPMTTTRKDFRAGFPFGIERRGVLMLGFPLVLFIMVTFANYSYQWQSFMARSDLSASVSEKVNVVRIAVKPSDVTSGSGISGKEQEVAGKGDHSPQAKGELSDDRGVRWMKNVSRDGGDEQDLRKEDETASRVSSKEQALAGLDDQSSQAKEELSGDHGGRLEQGVSRDRGDEEDLGKKEMMPGVLGNKQAVAGMGDQSSQAKEETSDDHGVRWMQDGSRDGGDQDLRHKEIKNGEVHEPPVNVSATGSPPGTALSNVTMASGAGLSNVTVVSGAALSNVTVASGAALSNATVASTSTEQTMSAIANGTEVSLEREDDVEPSFPDVSQLRLLQNYDSLKEYAETSGGLESAAPASSGLTNDCRTDVSDDTLSAGFASNSTMTSEERLHNCSKQRRLVKLRLLNVSLSDVEKDITGNERSMYWLDLSRKIPDSHFAHCISCCLEHVVRDAAGNVETCSVLRKEKPWCDLWCPLRLNCYRWYAGLLRERTKFAGHSTHHFRQLDHQPYIAVFPDAYVTRDGYIYNNEVAFNTRWRCPRTSLSMIKPERAWRKFRYKKVIVLDTYWQGHYHDLADSLAPMTAYYKELLADPDIKVHTSADEKDELFEETPDVLHRSPPSLVELMEILGISRSRLVTGDVYGSEVIAVEFSCVNNDGLGAVYQGRLSQIIHNILQRDDNHSRLTGSIQEIGKGNILVVKRSFNRVVENHDALVEALNRSCTKKVEVYDDTHNLTQKEIWGLFYRADMVIAPHGAALANVVAARKGAVVYEFLQPFHLDSDPANMNLCFKDLSTILGLRYFADFPLAMKIPEEYFNATSSVWVKPSTSMVIDVERTIRNVKIILENVIDVMPQDPQFMICPSCHLFGQAVADILMLGNATTVTT